MSMDPSKWIGYTMLSDHTRKRLDSIYPYVNLENSQFQEKESGVFMRQNNSVKIEKLLDEERPAQKVPIKVKNKR